MGNYYGSALNKFIGENCPHDFTNINIDCLQLRWEDKIMRLIEFKHTTEKLGKQQYKALKFLSDRLCQLSFDGWQFKTYIIKGDEPFNQIEIISLDNNTTQVINGRDNVIQWLSFRLDNK